MKNINERITKNFKKSNKNFFGDFPIEEYYLFSLSLRKELLSDILEYESFMADILIEYFDFFSLSQKDVERYLDPINNKYLKTGAREVLENEIRLNRHSKLLNDLKESKLGINVKIRKVFENISLGGKIHFIKKIDSNMLIDALDPLLTGKDEYYNHDGIILDPLDDFLFPFLGYIRDLRNILSHRNINLAQNDLFLNAFRNIPHRKHKINFFNKVLRDQLILMHEDTFYNRMENKTKQNPKISNGIFYEIMSQPM